MRFEAPSPRMVGWFAVAVAAMAAHKVECWYEREWLVSPLFARLIGLAEAHGSSTADAIGAALFASFVWWLFVGLAMVLATLWGGRGPIVVLGLWGLTFALEWHHLARAVTAWDYYPGLYTAVVYVAIGPFYWREWARHVRVGTVERLRRSPP